MILKQRALFVFVVISLGIDQSVLILEGIWGLSADAIGLMRECFDSSGGFFWLIIMDEFKDMIILNLHSPNKIIII